MDKVHDIFSQVLGDYIAFAAEVLELQPPYTLKLGAIGLHGVCVSCPAPNPYNNAAGPIHDNSSVVLRVVNTKAKQAQDRVVEAFIGELYDLAGVAE